MLIAMLIYVIKLLATAFIWIIILRVVLSWLIGFNVINGYNPYVRMFARFADRVTEPFLKPIRRALPDLGGLDISPMILLVAVYLLEYVLVGLLEGKPIL
jgi:YggT family protein